MSSPQQPGPSQPPLSPIALARGSACLPCRRRKMRCDGNKPVCGPCDTKGRREDCEYTGDIQGLTKTQLLEENIALLEARIRELENPSEATSIRLHGVAGDVTGPRNLSLSPTIPGPSGVASPAYAPALPIMPAIAAPAAEPTILDVHSMINAFIPYAPQLGFFLSVTRFVQLAYLPTGQREPLTESLVSAVCLWGSHLSKGTSINAFESRLLSKAIQDVSTSLFLANSGDRGHAILGVIQAEVLLANYFFALGRFLEGKYHCSAAASLAITCRLNTLGLPLAADARAGLGMGLVRGSYAGFAAASADDSVDQGERVNAFWAVYVLDKCWSVALGSPSSISESSTSSTRISTPWPLTMAQYEKGQSVAYTGIPIVAEFLSGGNIGNLEYSSPLALRAQASTLFSKASVLASHYQDGMPDKPVFWHEFSALDALINTFVNNLPPAPAVTPGDSDSLEHLVACTVARAAVIQLHIRFAREQVTSRDSCLASANAILATVQNVTVNHVGCIEPIVAILFSAVCQVYLGEIKASSEVHDNDYVGSLHMSLDHILAIMEDLGTVCPLMVIQVEQVRGALADL